MRCGHGAGDFREPVHSMIEIHGLVHRFGEAPETTEALRGIDLAVGEGEFVALLGPNGCGKTTLAKHLNALLFPTEGEVLVDGRSTSDPAELWEIRRRVGMVFQDPDRQMVASVVEEEVAFGPENLGVPPAEIRRRIGWALEALGIQALRRAEPNLLSGGQKQRVAIASVLVMEPRYLVMDEPTAMLDPLGRREVLRAVHDLRSNLGLTVLYVTHHMEEVLQADRVVALQEGRVALQGAPSEVFARVEELRNLGLDIPSHLELAWRLRASGLDLPEGLVAEEVLAEAVLRRWRELQ